MSSFTTLARPYARAAFDAASDSGTLSSWERALHVAATIAADDNVKRAIGDPAVNNETVNRLFETPDAPEGFDSMVALLAENDRLVVLPEIATLFSVLKNEAEQTLAVTVRSATELETAYQGRLEESLAARFGKQITLKVEIDPSVLGGAVIEAGDLVIDGSVSGKLARLAAAMRGL